MHLQEARVIKQDCSLKSCTEIKLNNQMEVAVCLSVCRKTNSLASSKVIKEKKRCLIMIFEPRQKSMHLQQKKLTIGL